jgi:hypothetical protein
MTVYPSPIYVGQFDPLKASDIVDLYLDVAADLVPGETITAVTFAVTDSDGATVAGVVGAHTETDSRTDFRVTAPATTGSYQLAAVFTISDGQRLTKVADFDVA